VGLAAGSSESWEDTVRGALAEEARVERLVRDLLLLACLDQEAGSGSTGDGATAEGSVVDLGNIVATELEARPSREGVTVQAETINGATVHMPMERARRVVANLVDNAQRYATSQVQVAVTIGGKGWIELVVQDDGPGIAPWDRERVFERFTRIDPARSADEGGAGLGLAIVRDIVTRYGGTVRFVDCPDGARAVVRMPHSSIVQMPVVASQRAPGSGGDYLARSSRLRLLLLGRQTRRS
ncbi:MAG TPA: ATP-binding protein, partial [Acidimicrobiales bacterium]|nr:ATP-binding protein [Acidimicrobiales bacterium]